MSLTLNNVQKIAKLSRLSLSSQEQESMVSQLNHIMAWVDQLQSIDISSCDNTPPLEDSMRMTEREDNVTVSNQLEDVLRNAPQAEHDMFAVPKVIE